MLAVDETDSAQEKKERNGRIVSVAQKLYLRRYFSRNCELEILNIIFNLKGARI